MNQNAVKCFNSGVVSLVKAQYLNLSEVSSTAEIVPTCYIGSCWWVVITSTIALMCLLTNTGIPICTTTLKASFYSQCRLGSASLLVLHDIKLSAQHVLLNSYRKLYRCKVILGTKTSPSFIPVRTKREVEKIMGRFAA